MTEINDDNLKPRDNGKLADTTSSETKATAISEATKEFGPANKDKQKGVDSDKAKAADEDCEDTDSVWDRMEAEEGERTSPTAERRNYGEMLRSAAEFLESIRGELNPPR